MTDLTVGRVTFGPTPEERATSLLKEDAVFEFTFSAQRKDAARLIAKQIEKAEQAAAEKARMEERAAFTKWLNEMYCDIARKRFSFEKNVIHCDGGPSDGGPTLQDAAQAGFFGCLLSLKAAIRARGEGEGDG